MKIKSFKIFIFHMSLSRLMTAIMFLNITYTDITKVKYDKLLFFVLHLNYLNKCDLNKLRPEIKRNIIEFLFNYTFLPKEGKV